MNSQKNIDYYLLESISSVEEFLKTQFLVSSSKLKKYFGKAFLRRSLPKYAHLSLPLNFVNDGHINPEYLGPPIPILYEDEIFLVMNKPEKIFVHPLSYDEQNNCLSFLRQQRAEVLRVNPHNYDRGLLYRLDFETSGVLIYIKNEQAYFTLRNNFKEMAKTKTYLCLVEGECSLSGTFVHYFSSKDIKGKKIVVFDHDDVLDPKAPGELHLKRKMYDPQNNTSLMEVHLKTGLRHQIRAQMAHLQFPLRGDVFYGGQKASRLYLHAFQYEILYENQSFLFQSEDPQFLKSEMV